MPVATDRHCLVAGPTLVVQLIPSVPPCRHAPADGVIPEGCGYVAVTSKALVKVVF